MVYDDTKDKIIQTKHVECLFSHDGFEEGVYYTLTKIDGVWTYNNKPVNMVFFPDSRRLCSYCEIFFDTRRSYCEGSMCEAAINSFLADAKKEYAEDLKKEEEFDKFFAQTREEARGCYTREEYYIYITKKLFMKYVLKIGG